MYRIDKYLIEQMNVKHHSGKKKINVSKLRSTNKGQAHEIYMEFYKNISPVFGSKIRSRMIFSREYRKYPKRGRFWLVIRRSWGGGGAIFRV